MRLLSPLLLCAALASAAGAQDGWDARITRVQGEVSVDLPGSSGAETESPAEADMPLAAGDTVRTGPDGTAEIALEADSLFELGPNSEFTVGSLERNDSSFSLLLGQVTAKLRSMISSGGRLSVRTPTAVAAVRGTEFAVNVSPEEEKTTVGVFDEGRVAVSPGEKNAGTFEETALTPNQETEINHAGPATRLENGRRVLRVGELRRLRGARGTVLRLHARRAFLRGHWRSLPPERRQELRRKLQERRRQFQQAPASAPARSRSLRERLQRLRQRRANQRRP